MIKRLIFPLSSVLLFLASCTTTRLAQQNNDADDVYNSSAKAQEVKYVQYNPPASLRPEPAIQQDTVYRQDQNPNYVTSQQLYGDSRNNGYDNDPYYENDYSARIYRFRNYTPWRSYYDTYYDYQSDPFYSNSYYSYNYYGYSRPFTGIYIGFGRPYSYYSYNPWNCYGCNGYGNYWSPYSYYDSYPHGGGYYSGHNGYYGGYGKPIYSSPSYKTRPNRETENVHSRGDRYYNPNTNNGYNGGHIENSDPRTNSRPDRYSNPANNSSERNQNSYPQSAGDESTRPSRPTRSGHFDQQKSQPQQNAPSRSDRPSRSGDFDQQRPQPHQNEQPSNRPSRTQRESSEQPVRVERQSSPQPSSFPSRSSGSSSSSEGRSRPSRGGDK